MYNGDREHVFASPQRPKQPISTNAMIQVLYRMGYKGRATVHGFRATASTYLNESGYNQMPSSANCPILRGIKSERLIIVASIWKSALDCSATGVPIWIQ
jgi:integrase